jgi:uncharacterized DUF497 family protein
MKVTFDPAKRAKTITKRGLDFADAQQVFLGNHITIADDRKDYGEQRFITIGFLASRMVVLDWTARQGTRRIVSMRKANDREQKIFAPRLA